MLYMSLNTFNKSQMCPLFLGLLHIEMNICKAFVKLNWEVFMEEISKAFGFKRETALKYARNCSDHRKTWRMLEIVMIGFTDELLYPYVKHSIAKEEEVSIACFIDLLQGRKSCEKNLRPRSQKFIPPNK